MAKDRTRSARRRSGDFYRARREAQLVRWVNDFARNADALDVTMGDVLIDVARFLGAFYVHYVRDGGPR